MTKKEKKTCYGCAYRGKVPGSAHTRCKFDWSKSNKEMPQGDERGIKNGWWIFPLNYDPIWMEGECQAFSKTAKKSMIKEKYDPILEIAAIFASVGRKF